MPDLRFTTPNCSKLITKQFRDTWLVKGSQEFGYSFPADQPKKRIDYILTRQADKVEVKKTWIVNTLASDHVPVLADLEFR